MSRMWYCHAGVGRFSGQRFYRTRGRVKTRLGCESYLPGGNAFVGNPAVICISWVGAGTRVDRKEADVNRQIARSVRDARGLWDEIAIGGVTLPAESRKGSSPLPRFIHARGPRTTPVFDYFSRPLAATCYALGLKGVLSLSATNRPRLGMLVVPRVLPARYPPGPWPAQMRADMVATFFDFENAAELVAAVKRGEAPPPSAMRKRGKNAEPIWSRAHLERFSAPSIAVLEHGTEFENLESLV
jgi:hypothetical protein